MIAYACPHCKLPLENYFCRQCAIAYPVNDGIPCFIPDSPAPDKPDVRHVYDDIYHNHQDAWVDQGRSADFLAYFSGLARSCSQDRVLEIGCGEGALLAAMTATQKFGIDPSINALRRAIKRSDAKCAVARSEQLPFPSESFDLVVTVGVMEHFEDPECATREINRVLSTRGRLHSAYPNRSELRRSASSSSSDSTYFQNSDQLNLQDGFGKRLTIGSCSHSVSRTP